MDKGGFLSMLLCFYYVIMLLCYLISYYVIKCHFRCYVIGNYVK